MVIDWTQIYKKYKGLWVALKQDEKTVVASAKTAGEVLSKAKNEGHDNPILFRVPNDMVLYIG